MSGEQVSEYQKQVADDTEHDMILIISGHTLFFSQEYTL